MSTTPDSFQRTEDFEARIDSVLLPDEAWAVFAQLDKAATVAEIATACGLDAAAVQKQIDLLIQNKLVRKKLVNWREFLAQKGISTGPTRMSPAGPQPAPAVLAGQARRPAPPPAPAPTVPAISRCEAPEPADPEGTISFRLANEPARRARRASLAMCITFRLDGSTRRPPVRVAPAPAVCSPVAEATPIQPAPVATPDPALELAAASVARGESGTPPVGSTFAPRKLRTVIDAITRKGGGGLNGQLLVYRVFLRVPPALMFAAGIKSLNLIDDSIELHDERTYDAIRAAARTVASLELDEVLA